MESISNNLRLPLYDGTEAARLSVEVNGADTNDNLPDGSIVIRGQAGTSFALRGLAIRATNDNITAPAPAKFNENNSTTTFKEARDTGVYDTSIQVYDKTGAVHDLTMTFIHTGRTNEWEWEASFPGGEEISDGGSGTITFGTDGTVSSFNYANNASSLEVSTGAGIDEMSIDLNLGGPGDFQGVTQFEAATTVSATSQDGYSTGALTDISIDSYGFISGVFTNGTTRNSAQITVVDFVNPGGLQKISDSVYSTSPNSGDPVRGTPGEQSSSKLRPGALESSNVEMAREFTEMITTQRGYQANSRVITVSDSMLEELMSLKR
jgi:flagellar hook protein FlgE